MAPGERAAIRSTHRKSGLVRLFPEPNLCDMDIRLSPDQEERLARLAARDGRSMGDVVRDAIVRYLDDDARFVAAVKIGLAAAQTGDFVAADEVWANVERTLKS
jgi:predicted transcriptional regulator